MALATNSTPGDIQLAGDLDGTSPATAPELKCTTVTPGSYNFTKITVDAKGRLTAASEATQQEINSVVPVATGVNPGLVTIGDGLSVDGSGNVTADVATTTSKGVVQIGSGLEVVNGVISVDGGQAGVADATTTSKGVVQIGSGLDVTAGVVSVDQSQFSDATTTSKGIVQIGSGLDVNAGVVDIDTSVVATLDGGNTYTKAQNVQSVALSSGANISADASLSNIFTLTLSSSGQLDNPTNLQPGSYTFIVTQDGVGSHTLSFGSNYKFKNGFDNTIASSPGSVSIISCVATGTALYCAVAKEFV